MRFTSGDVKDHIVSSKIDQRISVVALKSNTCGGEVQRSTFARFSGGARFYWHKTDLPGRARHVSYRG